MTNYKKLYLMLFNAITDALEELDNQNFWTTKNILQLAQQQAEDEYIS